MRLTAAGSVFLKDARGVLARSERAIWHVRRTGRGESGQLTVGYTSLIHYPFVPEVLRLYRACYPGVEIVLRDMVTIEQMRWLHINTLNISFAA